MSKDAIQGSLESLVLFNKQVKLQQQSNMKFIILLAVCFSAAFAAQVPSLPNSRTITVNKLYENVVQKFKAVKNHKNLPKLLENPPGLVEVVDQAVKSFEDVYAAVETVADKTVSLIRKYELEDVLPAELPRIVQKAGIDSHENAVYWIQFWNWYRQMYGVPPLTPEAVVDLYISHAIVNGIINLPLRTYDGILELINERSSDAASEFEAIISEGVDRAMVALGEFGFVLNEALQNAGIN